MRMKIFPNSYRVSGSYGVEARTNICVIRQHMEKRLKSWTIHPGIIMAKFHEFQLRNPTFLTCLTLKLLTDKPLSKNFYWLVLVRCKFGPLEVRTNICVIWQHMQHWQRAWRLPGRWPDGGRGSTVVRWTRRRAVPAYAPIPDLTWQHMVKRPN